MLPETNKLPTSIIDSTTTEKLRECLVRDCTRILTEWPPEKASRGSTDVYLGASGIALLFLKIHERDSGFAISTRSALSLANDYITAALTRHQFERRKSSRPSLSDPFKAGTVAPLGNITNWIGFLCSEVGLYAVAAAVSYHIGAHDETKTHIEQLVTLSRSSYLAATPTEVLYGRAGYLYALKFVLHNTGPLGPALIQPPLIREVISTVIEAGHRGAADVDYKSPLFWTFHHQRYIGAAHGAAGILAALMLFPEQLGEWESEIKDSMNFVCDQADREGNWPAVWNQKSNLTQFCHGSCGVGICVAKAYEVFSDPRYLSDARIAAKDVWREGIIFKGVGLCHGTSGNAYLFLILYRITGDPTYLSQALEFALACTEWEERTNKGEMRTPDHPWSLFEGLGGAVWLVSDLLFWSAENFKGFPCFTDI